MPRGGDDLVSIVNRPLAENWTVSRIMDEIDDAWLKYEIWRGGDASLTRMQRIHELTRIESAAHRLLDLLAPMSGSVRYDDLMALMSDSVRHDLIWNYPAIEPAPHIEDTKDEPSAKTLRQAVSGVKAIRIAAKQALQAWERPDARGFREEPGVLAQQYFLGKALPEIFERAFVEKNQQPCKFALSHKGLGQSPGGRFVEWAWHKKSRQDLSISKARTSREAVSKGG